MFVLHDLDDFYSCLVLVDSESALATDKVQHILHRYGVRLAIFPKGLGHLMTPSSYFCLRPNVVIIASYPLYQAR